MTVSAAAMLVGAASMLVLILPMLYLTYVSFRSEHHSPPPLRGSAESE